jgi:hypothetical protein
MGYIGLMLGNKSLQSSGSIAVVYVPYRAKSGVNGTIRTHKVTVDAASAVARIGAAEKYHLVPRLLEHIGHIKVYGLRSTPAVVEVID